MAARATCGEASRPLRGAAAQPAQRLPSSLLRMPTHPPQTHHKWWFWLIIGIVAAFVIGAQLLLGVG